MVVLGMHYGQYYYTVKSCILNQIWNGSESDLITDPCQTCCAFWFWSFGHK